MGNIEVNKEKQEPTTAMSPADFKQKVFEMIKKCPKGAVISDLKLEQKFKDDIIRRSFGCLFGCFIGDALGAYCQFNTSTLGASKLKETMQMNGGGVFNLHKGQFTDDSQMAYHLLKALSQFNLEQPFFKQKEVILAKIMKQYLRWDESVPFDQGLTCRKGIEIIHKNKNKLQTEQRGQLRLNVQYILSEVKKVNDKSQSNGSLMRIAPLAIFFSFINEDPTMHRDFIVSQISTIHPNELLQSAGYVWVKVLYDLITRKNDEKQTYAQIYDNAKKLPQSKVLFEWFKQAQKQPKMSATDNMGWAKIAWTYGMKLVYGMGRQNTKLTTATLPDYVNEIRDVIKEAGDSDTNAAIVGGLVGAIIGFQKLHLKYLENIFNLSFPDPMVEAIDRPKYYEPLSIFFQLLAFHKKCVEYKLKNYPHNPHPNLLKGNL